MDQLSKQVGFSDDKKVRCAKMKLIFRAMDYWNDIENLHLRFYKLAITDWDERKNIYINSIESYIYSNHIRWFFRSKK